jgi:hypothetical protein
MRRPNILTVALLVPLLLAACGGQSDERIAGSPDTAVVTSAPSSDENIAGGADTPVETVITAPGEAVTESDRATETLASCPEIPETDIDVENPIPADAAAQLVGLSEQVAATCAANEGWSIRVVARDDEEFMVTADYRADRVNLTVENDVVTAISVG